MPWKCRTQALQHVLALASCRSVGAELQLSPLRAGQTVVLPNLVTYEKICFGTQYTSDLMPTESTEL